MKKIVSFGDSYVWGDELIDPKLATQPDAHPVLIENTKYREQNCYTGLLANSYGIPYENFGIPGGSLQSTVWTYLWWLDNEKLPIEDCLVLVGLTEPGRHSFYNPKHRVYPNDTDWNRFVHSSWIHSNNSSDNEQWHELVKLHTVLTDCQALRDLTLHTTQLFFENTQHSHPVVQFFTLNHTATKPYSTLWNSTQSLRDLTLSPKLQKPNGHPNEIGHKIIKEVLQEYIYRAILS
jgi:hypothetical protein